MKKTYRCINWNDKESYNKFRWEIATVSDKSDEYLYAENVTKYVASWRGNFFHCMCVAPWILRGNRSFYRDTLVENKKSSHFESITALLTVLFPFPSFPPVSLFHMSIEMAEWRRQKYKLSERENG